MSDERAEPRHGERSARGRSMVSRVVRGTVLVALLSSLTLAATAATISRVLWRSREERALEETAAALARAIDFEAREDATSREQAAPGALAESAVAGYHVEVWKGSTLLASNESGPPLGPSSGWSLGPSSR